MDIVALIVDALACWQIVEIWHHGDIFSDWRSRLELRSGILSDLLLCPFCLSVWIGLIIYILSLNPYTACLIYGFAISRTANVMNDVLHKWCRTPKSYKELSGSEEQQQEDI